MFPLDGVLPEYDAREHHQRVLDLAPAAAVERVLSVPAAPDAVTRALLAMRRVPGRNDSVSGLLRALGAHEVERTEAKAVYVRPGRVEIAVAFWAADADGGRALLRTETRVRANDARARVIFRLYWLVVRPWSGLIRRRWLRAAARP